MSPKQFSQKIKNSNNESIVSVAKDLLYEFDKSMVKSGFLDRSKAIQTTLHTFIDQNIWEEDKR